MRLLHVSPHPDDELLGAGATLMAMRDAGWHISNFAVSLGRAGAHEQRATELRKSCKRAGFDLLLPTTPFAISADDDLVSTQTALSAKLKKLVGSYDIIVSPSPHDQHPGHELVARAVAAALKDEGAVNKYLLPRWWMWGLWGELPLPNIICPFTSERLQELEHALSAHTSQLARNNYSTLLEARAKATAVLACERVFGFGSERLPDVEYAEVCCEVVRVDGEWKLGFARVLDPAHPLAAPAVDAADVSFWISESSLAQRMHFRAGVRASASA